MSAPTVPRDVADMTSEERERLYLAAWPTATPMPPRRSCVERCPPAGPRIFAAPGEARRDLVAMLREEGLPDPARVPPAGQDGPAGGDPERKGERGRRAGRARARAPAGAGDPRCLVGRDPGKEIEARAMKPAATVDGVIRAASPRAPG